MYSYVHPFFSFVSVPCFLSFHLITFFLNLFSLPSPFSLPSLLSPLSLPHSLSSDRFRGSCREGRPCREDVTHLYRYVLCSTVQYLLCHVLLHYDYFCLRIHTEPTSLFSSFSLSPFFFLHFPSLPLSLPLFFHSLSLSLSLRRWSFPRAS